MKSSNVEMTGACSSNEVVDFLERDLGVTLYPYQKDFIRKQFVLRRKPLSHLDLETLDAMQIVEAITNQKNWIFKMRRLAGKDYIVEFKKLADDPEDSVVYRSRPQPTYLEAVRNSAQSVIEGEGWDNERFNEQGADNRLTELFRGAKDQISL